MSKPWLSLRSALFILALLSGMTHLANAGTASATGLWQEKSKLDSLTGKKYLEVYEAPTDNTDGDFTWTRIIIRCDPDQTLDFILMWDQQMTQDASSGTVHVDYRIGHEDIRSETWVLATNGWSLFYGGNVAAFISHLETSNDFVARIYPTGMDVMTATYDTTGLTKAVEPLMKSCGFDQPTN
jgi:hypothetical protein